MLEDIHDGSRVVGRESRALQTASQKPQQENDEQAAG